MFPRLTDEQLAERKRLNQAEAEARQAIREYRDSLGAATLAELVERAMGLNQDDDEDDDAEVEA